MSNQAIMDQRWDQYCGEYCTNALHAGLSPRSVGKILAKWTSLMLARPEEGENDGQSQGQCSPGQTW